MQSINPGGPKAEPLGGKDLAQNCHFGPYPVHQKYGLMNDKCPVIYDPSKKLIREFCTLDSVEEAIQYYLGIPTHLIPTTEDCTEEYDSQEGKHYGVEVYSKFAREVWLPEGFTGCIQPGQCFKPYLDESDPDCVHVSCDIFEPTNDPDEAIAYAQSFAPCPCWRTGRKICQPKRHCETVSVASDEAEKVEVEEGRGRMKACLIFPIKLPCKPSFA